MLVVGARERPEPLQAAVLLDDIGDQCVSQAICQLGVGLKRIEVRKWLQRKCRLEPALRAVGLMPL